MRDLLYLEQAALEVGLTPRCRCPFSLGALRDSAMLYSVHGRKFSSLVQMCPCTHNSPSLMRRSCPPGKRRNGNCSAKASLGRHRNLLARNWQIRARVDLAGPRSVSHSGLHPGYVLTKEYSLLVITIYSGRCNHYKGRRYSPLKIIRQNILIDSSTKYAIETKGNRSVGLIGTDGKCLERSIG